MLSKNELQILLTFYLFSDAEHKSEILHSWDFLQLFVLMELHIPALYLHHMSLTNHH